MRAVCWNGVHDVRVERVPDPQIVNPHDAIVRITSTAICGSDLHLYDGYIPTMRPGDILGHEFMGEVVEIGPEVKKLKVGDRVVVPFTISCGGCWFCKRQQFAMCDNTNPNAAIMEASYGHSAAGIFGYSHLFGGYAGGQAEYARVPMADVGPLKVPSDLTDEQVLFLSDIFPTGYQAALDCDIKEGDTVAVWGCGPVGQFAVRSCLMLGASQVYAIDHFPRRLQMAEQANGDGRVRTLDFDDEEVYHTLMEWTGGRGPDACIDAVGLEAHGSSFDAVYDRVKVGTMLATDRIHVLRQAMRCCRKGGTIAVPGVYGGVADKYPIGAQFGKGVVFKGGQTHVQQHMQPLLEHIQRGEIDPPSIITHRIGIEEAPEAYRAFKQEQDECLKVVIHND